MDQALGATRLYWGRPVCVHSFTDVFKSLLLEETSGMRSFLPASSDILKPSVKSPLLAHLTGELFTGPYCPPLPCPSLPSLLCGLLGSRKEFCITVFSRASNPLRGVYTELQGLCQLPTLSHDPESTTHPSRPPISHSLCRKLPLDSTWRVRSADQLSGSAYTRKNNSG